MTRFNCNMKEDHNAFVGNYIVFVKVEVLDIETCKVGFQNKP